MRALVAVLSLALAAPAAAKPAPTRTAVVKKVTRPPKGTAGTAGTAVAAAATKSKIDGAHARITVGRFGELRPAREIVGRREEPLSPEEETAKQIAKLLRGPLRYGTTGLFVADARTGEPLFAINADDPLNPASNVKMISTATALELLGPEFRYPTRLLGPAPVNGVVHGDVYLLGSYDPTLTSADLDEIAIAAAQRGITAIEGGIVVGADPARDGIYRAIVPIEITAGEPGKPPNAVVTAGADHVRVEMTAITAKRAQRPRLTFRVDANKDAAGRPHLTVHIGGVLGKGGSTMYPLVTKERTATAAYAMRGALRAHAITITGDLKFAELGDFVGDAAGTGTLPIELGRHDSATLADIIAHVNKWSINWLADRVIMTAAALTRHQQPTMEIALDAMYGWLARHPHYSKDDLLVDTGSGLSYRTRVSAQELASIVRNAAGFAPGVDPAVAQAWLSSLSISGTDGTLRHRFRSVETRGHIHGKTGTLSTAIALSGVLDIDPARPVVFSLVTNGDVPLSKGYVRKAHELVVGALCAYLAKTNKANAPGDHTPAPVLDLKPSSSTPEDVEEAEPDAALDAEAAAAGAP